MSSVLLPEHGVYTEAKLSQLDLYDKFKVDKSLHNAFDQRIAPSNGIKTGPYHFVIESQPDTVVDLKHTLVEVNFKLCKSDSKSSNFTAEEAKKIDTAGNALTSMFETVKVAINGKYVNTDSSYHIPYKAIILDWLDLKRDRRAEIQGLKEKRYVKDAQNNITGSRYNEDSFFKDGRIVQYIGHFPIDILSANNYLSPRNNMSLTFYRSSDAFFLTGSDRTTTARPKVVIESMYVVIGLHFWG